MPEIAIIIIKFTNINQADEYINTELTLNEIKTAIHFFEERKRKNIKGGRPQKINAWVQRIENVKHYFTFEELDTAYKNKEIGRDSYYRIHQQLKALGWNRKLLDLLYKFTYIIRRLTFIICNFQEYKKARIIFHKAERTFQS